MANYTESIEKLIQSLIKLPGIGRRSAERVVSYILGAPKEETKTLAEAMVKVKENVRFCSLCHNLSEEDLCKICQDSRRQKDVICIVEKPGDVMAIEKSGSFNGVYHVLLGAISPLEGKGPTDLKIDTLLNRIKQNNIKEIIIATDADTEGETTSLYLAKLIKPLGVKLSRIGLGLPVGSNLEYADSTTVSKSLESRRII
ncbi:MAG: recombination protein RecR [Candidatus Omnitrophica bacterium CG08_land_8_20_14_0_20_41_16]|uniref:Recombination protein RecR n=1 Tax=Candidatus Sherwoodlollariibacterium unditelluris TaxID=1974757 RepID=A0A2G9YHH4_9BACT|nr:MAG: recombination protein RecR [Candidatus Omnitrophica bacterium CG23_combo_of_CG06-09_8_20_14_all_41_10]PIS33371.1 MAG: recombination protein RecR [Candidatus Omnitrophica bacterium CG08_land_8_20_14_0_20_41_16]